MATAKKRGAPASALKAERQPKPKRDYEAERLARIKKRQDNRKKYDADRAKLGDVAKQVIDAVLSEPKKNGRPLKTISYQEMTAEMLAWFEEKVIARVWVKDMPGLRDDFPSEFQLWSGIADEASALSRSYARAKQFLVAKLEEHIAEVSETTQLGVTTIRGQRVTKDGDVVDVEEVREADMLGHRTLVVDTLKWQLAHIRPKKHGKNPDAGAAGVNPQLQALFDSIKNGPAKAEEDEE